MEWGNQSPQNRYYQLEETNDDGYVPTVYVDSCRLYVVGSDDHYNDYRGFIVNSQSRQPQATMTATYEVTGNTVTFTVIVTNNSTVTLSTSNNAAVHGIVYEDYRAVKTNRIGRGTARAAITSLAPGATQTYTINVPISNVVDHSKLHFLAVVDYRASTHKDVGLYDQLQATVAIPRGFVVSPSDMKFSVDALEETMPTGTVQVLGDPGQTWSATVDKDWLSLSPASGNINSPFTVSFDRSKLQIGKQNATITVVDGSGENTRTVAVEMNLVLPDFTLYPTTINRNVYQGSAVPSDYIVTRGDNRLNYTATADQPWLLIPVATGTVGGSIKITYDPTKLEPGLQTATVTVKDDHDFYTFTVTVNVKYIVGETPQIKLYIPSVMKP